LFSFIELQLPIQSLNDSETVNSTVDKMANQ